MGSEDAAALQILKKSCDIDFSMLANPDKPALE
jgi:hypothetical protein